MWGSKEPFTILKGFEHLCLRLQQIKRDCLLLFFFFATFHQYFYLQTTTFNNLVNHQNE